MTQQEIIQTLLGIIGVGIVGIFSFTVKYLKEIAKNLSDLNIKIAVVISNHENLETQVKTDHENLEKRISVLEEKI